METKPYRAHEAVITVCQRNARKSIEIVEASEAASRILGYQAKDLQGKNLSFLLPPRIAAMVEEYVEFLPDGNDIAAVLGKVKDFTLLGSDNSYRPFQLKLARLEAGAEGDYFRLILRSPAQKEEDNGIRRLLAEHHLGHEVKDETTGLCDLTSLVKTLEMVHSYAVSGGLKACFALLAIDGYDDVLARHGKAMCDAWRRHIADQCRQQLREDDLLGEMGDRYFGLALLEVEPDTARLVCNRLRATLAARPFAIKRNTLNYTVSIVFSAIGETQIGNVIANCKAMLAGEPAQAGNLVLQAA